MTKLKENLQTQLFELETLQSMFYNPGELRIEDPVALAHVNAFLNGITSDAPPFLDITINLSLEAHKFELCANLSHEYPEAEPDLYVRNHKLNRKQHADLNKDLAEFVSNLDRGEPCIYSATSWIQDNAHKYIVPEDVEEKKKEALKVKDTSLIRYWIYSHHIYSKTKRREIVSLANSLNITGFCMPGKPGIVCVEGCVSDCNEWWQTIKSMNWKRIYCKITEEAKGAPNFLKFKTFEEVVFQNNSIKCNHMDMGELFKYLEDHQCGHVFREIFGVEARVSL